MLSRSMYSSTASTAQHSIAQHSTITRPKAANQVRADRCLGCFPGVWSSCFLQVACSNLECWTMYHIICLSVPFFRERASRADRAASKAHHSTAQHSTAQHSSAQHNQPCTKQQTKYVPIRARQRKQADRVGESQHVVEHFIQH